MSGLLEDPFSPVRLGIRTAQFIKAGILMPTLLAMTEAKHLGDGLLAPETLPVVLLGGRRTVLGDVELPEVKAEDVLSIIAAFGVEQKKKTQGQKLRDAGLPDGGRP